MIELKDICKSFGDHVVLKNFSLKINKNEFIAIIGESGAGKTTILNMISMIDKPDSGSISINGKNSFSKKDVQDLRRYVFGYIFQNYALIENDTVKENLLLSKKYRKDFKEKELGESLEKVGISKEYLGHKVCELSGGEQQRIAIARTMLKPCEIILADEPTGNLDTNNKEKIIHLFKELKKEGKIRKFGFSFHDDAETLDRILTEHPDVDFVQLQINYFDWNNKIIQSHLCYETAVRHGKPIIVMEPVKGGTLANLPKEAADLLRDFNPDASPASYALRFAASLDNVFMVLSGMNTMEQVLDNTSVFDNLTPLNEDEKEILEKVIKIIEKSVEIPCTSCGYCMEVCPKNIPIPQLFGLYNNYKINNNFSNMYHNRIIYNRGKSSDCLNCHRCEKNCPQHIAIPDNLKKIAAFEK